MDFKKRGFCQEQLKWHKKNNQALPFEFTSQQTSDANIFVIGGFYRNATESTISNGTLQIDANLTAYEREPMKTPRFSAPLALVRDRFILALGGFVSKHSTTKLAECYDT